MYAFTRYFNLSLQHNFIIAFFYALERDTSTTLSIFIFLFFFLDFFTTEKKKEKKEKNKPKKYLPRQCLYFAWILCLAAIVTCSVVLVLYGMSFGNTTSLMWLITIFLSLFKDVFAVQPIKIFITSLATAFLWKKINSQDETDIQKRNRREVVEQLLHQTINEKDRVCLCFQGNSQYDTNREVSRSKDQSTNDLNSQSMSADQSLIDFSNAEVNRTNSLPTDDVYVQSNSSHQIQIKSIHDTANYLPSKTELERSRLDYQKRKKLWDLRKALLIRIIFIAFSFFVPYSSVNSFHDYEDVIGINSSSMTFKQVSDYI